MSLLLARIVEDLRAFSSEMLELGIAPTSRQTVGVDRRGTVGLLLETVHLMSRLVPRLIDELEGQSINVAARERAVRVPVRARPPRRASEYDRTERGLLPRIWLKEEVAAYDTRTTAALGAASPRTFGARPGKRHGAPSGDGA